MRIIEGDCVEAMAALPECSVDAVVCDPPYNLSFMSKAWDRIDGESIDPAFCHWLAGFVDGEGCFHVHRKEVGDHEVFDCQFSITLRADDKPVLERIQRTLGMGTLADRQRTDGNPQARYCISRKADCLRLRDLFRAFPLRAKKAHDLELWSDALAAWVEHEPGGGWDDVAEARALLMASRAYVPEGVRVDPFQMWCWRWGREALRVLKPGGHILAFGGTRTYHRLTAGLEDAGFEIRDTIAWMYGSGFPKSLDVSKAIDKAARGVPQGGEDPTSEHHGQYKTQATEGKRDGSDAGKGYGAGPGQYMLKPGDFDPTTGRVVIGTRKKKDSYGEGAGNEVYGGGPDHGGRIAITAPASAESEQWQGWGTALKPAHEPIVVARKPLSGTVAQTVLEHGTGALNIDASRIGYEAGGSVASNPSLRDSIAGGNGGHVIASEPDRRFSTPDAGGRWPANIALSHSPGCVLTGTKRVKAATGTEGVGAFGTGTTFGDGEGLRQADEKGASVGKGDADGMEVVEAWECVEGCPVFELDLQAPAAGGGGFPGAKGGIGQGSVYGAPGSGAGLEATGRVDADGGASRFFLTTAAGREGEASADRRYADEGATDFAATPGPRGGDERGRWPANVTLDEDAAAALDEQSGDLHPPGNTQPSPGSSSIYGKFASEDWDPARNYQDRGGASRFFYTAKASTAERNAGLQGFEEEFAPTMGNGIGGKEHDPETATPKRNVHPTVKPIALMRWLVRLVTPPGGVVLDPFTGSGTTLCAAVLEGFDALGIERDPQYAELARARVAFWQSQPVGVDVDKALAAEAARVAIAATGQGSMF